MHGPEDSGIHPAIAHNEAALRLSSMFRKRFGCKRWARPFTVSSYKLPSDNIFFKLLVTLAYEAGSDMADP